MGAQPRRGGPGEAPGVLGFQEQGGTHPVLAESALDKACGLVELVLLLVTEGQQGHGPPLAPRPP